MSKKALLIIMDGWGHGLTKSADAISHAKTPFVDDLYTKYPHSELVTCGEAVGLPNGQMGNSEVGHLNLGAGRIVYQELQRINVSLHNGSLANNAIFNNMLETVLKHGKKLHIIGLVSDGGVHAHIEHLKSISTLLQSKGVEKHYIHAFTDGRDTDPKSGLGFLQDLENHISNTGGALATVVGRYYAMDRDKRWERVKVAYDALVKNVGVETDHILEEIEARYAIEETDEFLKPIINKSIAHESRIQPGDVVFCYNFRTDRCREITQALVEQDFESYGMKALPLHYVTMTEYDKSFQNVQVIFQNDNLTNTIGEVLQKNGKSQLRIAETEKYPHVTFFFSGGREQLFEGEDRILIESPKDVPTYDLKPEMSAVGIKNALIDALTQRDYDFICLNFANADMVGHTGVWEAVIKAVETVNDMVSEIVPFALFKGYTIFLTADHGNADFMVNEDGSPNTAHTLNKVPLFVIEPEISITKLQDGKLGDLAPTILKYLDIPIPEEMTGNVLI